MFAVKHSLLRLFTARDAVGTRQVGGAEMEENRKVRCLVTGSKAKLGVVVLAAPLSVDSPFIWAFGHGEEPRASQGLRIRHQRWKKGTHVQVTAKKVDVVLDAHMKRRSRSVDASQFLAKICGCVGSKTVTVGVPESEGRRRSLKRCVGGWYFARKRFSSLGEDAAVVSLGAVDM